MYQKTYDKKVKVIKKKQLFHATSFQHFSFEIVRKVKFDEFLIYKLPICYPIKKQKYKKQILLLIESLLLTKYLLLQH